MSPRWLVALPLLATAACSSIKRADMTGREAQLRYYEDHHIEIAEVPLPRRGGGRLILAFNHTEMNDRWTHSVHSEWLQIEMDISSVTGTTRIPSERVRLFGGEGGGMLGRAPHFEVVSAEGSVSLLGKSGVSLDAEVDLFLTLSRLDAPEERNRRVRGVFRFLPAFMRLKPEEADSLRRRLQESYQAKGARVDQWAVTAMSRAGITQGDAVEAVLQGSVVEDHQWSDTPSCLVFGETNGGRRLLVWCAWPPHEGLVIRNALEPTKNHQVFSEYADR